MVQQAINLGTVADDDTGDDLRTGGTKINENFTELYMAKQDKPAEGAFADGDKTKLDGIETSATADQTGAEMVSALNTELGSTNWQTGGSSSGLTAVANIAALTAITESGLTDGDVRWVEGFSTMNDGGQGVFVWDADNTATDVAGMIESPDTSDGTGRWVRQYSGPVNVKWFGAKGDGSTDDLAAFTAAFNAAIASGNHVYIPDPDDFYSLSAGITFTDIITIKGSGAYSCRIRADVSGPVFHFSSGSGGSVIESLTVSNENASGDGLKWTNSHRSAARDIRLGNGIEGKAFHNAGSMHLLWQNCYASTNGTSPWASSVRHDYGFYIEAGTLTTISNMSKLDQCEAAGSRLWGLYITANSHADLIANYLTVVNCTFQGCGADGAGSGGNIRITDAQYVSFHGCHCEAPQGSGLDVSLYQADGFQWFGGTMGLVKMDDTLGAALISARTSALEITNTCELPILIGGNHEVIKGNGKYGGRIQLGSPRGIRGTGAVEHATRGLYGLVVSENGQFSRWHDSSTPEGFSAYDGATLAQDADELSYTYSCRITSTGGTPSYYPGLALDLTEYWQDLIPRAATYPNGAGRIFVSFWIKKPASNTVEPIVLTDSGFDRLGTGFDGTAVDDTWTQIDLTFPLETNAMKVVISVGANAPSGEYILVDNVTIGLGESAPAVYSTAPWEAPKRAFIEGHRIEYDTAAPTSGSYLQGDIVYNSSPSAAGTIGWVCTTAGSPGTWKTFGTIAS